MGNTKTGSSGGEQILAFLLLADTDTGRSAMVEHRIFLWDPKKPHELVLALRSSSPVKVGLWAEKQKRAIGFWTG